jgi:hypothetical protein
MNNTDQELDTLIEAALTTYSSAEPRFGLEQRVLNRVLTEGGKRYSFLWMPTAAIVAVCALLLITILWVPRSPQILPPTPPAKVVVPATPEYRLIVQGHRAERSPRRQRRHDPALPTDLERALLILARDSPETLKSLRSEDQPVTIEPITIAAIEIKPLQSAEGE